MAAVVVLVVMLEVELARAEGCGGRVKPASAAFEARMVPVGVPAVAVAGAGAWEAVPARVCVCWRERDRGCSGGGYSAEFEVEVDDTGLSIGLGGNWILAGFRGGGTTSGRSVYGDSTSCGLFSQLYSIAAI